MSAQNNYEQTCDWGFDNKYFWLRGYGPLLYIIIYIFIIINNNNIYIIFNILNIGKQIL